MPSFTMPDFNLTCNVWHNPSLSFATLGAPSASFMANLANGRVAHLPGWVSQTFGIRPSSFQSSILVPALTDLRDSSVAGNPDIVEVPAGSQRFYWVVYCDDIAKGFGNEHRWAVLQKVYNYGAYAYPHWPAPMP